MPVPTPRRLAFASSRHPRRVLMAWLAVVLASIAVIAVWLPSATTTDMSFRGTPESMQGRDVLQTRMGVVDHDVESVVVRVAGGSVRDPGPRAAVTRATERLRAMRGREVESVVGPFDPGAPPAMVSRDGRAAVITVTMAGDVNEGERNITRILDVADAMEATDGVRAQVAGPASGRHANALQAQSDLGRGELMIGLPVALLILLLVFRAVGAMVLPLGVAAVSVIVALATTALVGQVHPVSFFITNMITTMGLAVGIDYALFIVARYREERATGRSVRDAVDTASATSGRAVGFSGIAVVVALAGLILVPTSIFESLALGAIFAVVVAVAASMTLLPAMLAIMGDRIEWLGRRPRRAGDDSHGRGYARVADAVMARPALAATLATVALLALAAPWTAAKTGANGIEALPPSSDARQAFQVLASDFGAGSGGPVLVTLEGDVTGARERAAIERLASAMGSMPHLGAVEVLPSPRGDAAVVRAMMDVAPTSDAATETVHTLRDTVVPRALDGSSLEAATTGETAFNVDFVDITDRYLPIVVSLVLGLSFVVLLVAFRSVVVPVVAIAMNLLSVGAAYGLLVLVFQGGVGAGLLGFHQVEMLDAWIPLFLFAVLFGLSMDYHVFLLSRIREEYDRTGDTPAAVRRGIATSARLITGAALIMVAVFGGFALGELVMFQQMGFGLAVAIFLDAFLVRTVLVPAVMRLLGRANWYLPGFMGFLPRIDLEGGRDDAHHV